MKKTRIVVSGIPWLLWGKGFEDLMAKNKKKNKKPKKKSKSKVSFKTLEPKPKVINPIDEFDGKELVELFRNHPEFAHLGF